MSERVAIALGSNLGDSRAILDGAVAELRSHFDRLQVSPWYRTKPVGPPQPDYLNGCAIAYTSLDPLAVLDRLQAIERQFGRVRGERWGARTLDLDVLLYGDRRIDLPRLQVPHPRMLERAFVLVPLADIAPDWCEPNSRRTIAQCAAASDRSGVVRVDA